MSCESAIVAIDIRTLGPGDEELLANAAAGVFDNPVAANLAVEFLNDPRHHPHSHVQYRPIDSLRDGT